MGFDPQGQALFAAFSDTFRQYNLEPATPVQHKLVAWAPPSDLMVTATSVICCSLSGTAATIWAGDADNQAAPTNPQPPLCTPRPHGAATGGNGQRPGAAPQRAEAAAQDVSDQLERGAKLSAAPQLHGTWRSGEDRELQPAVVQSAGGGDSSPAEPGSKITADEGGDDADGRQVSLRSPQSVTACACFNSGLAQCGSVLGATSRACICRGAAWDRSFHNVSVLAQLLPRLAARIRIAIGADHGAAR